MVNFLKRRFPAEVPRIGRGVHLYVDVTRVHFRRSLDQVRSGDIVNPVVY